MPKNNNKLAKVNQQNNKNNLIAAGVTGAIIGAGVAMVGVIAMKDEKAKKHIRNLSSTFYEQTIDYIKNVISENQKPVKNVLKKISGGKKDAK